ncbi:glucose 1-dehydrogenase [Thauera butanivorans]|uniref:glucose 1-dehydrogenase n=1 Tax=Thauera butanivorans TaxID=86174 RepID=UPI0008388583|nr:glucose 1-dehydrogenase [Thauera butanivorans]
MPLIERFRLDNQVAIVTGGGRGIGRAIALAYAEAGADVVCAARTPADVEAVAEEIRALGRRALAVQCDVTDLAQLAKLVDAAVAAFGRITHLVNNAGGSGPNDPLKMSADKFEHVFRFNVTSAYELTRLCVPHMRAAGGGNVLNITSGAARYAQPHFSAYGTAKAALSQLTRLLAQDFAPEVRVNAIAPGPIMTAALDRALPANMREGMIRNTPLQRLGEVEDIAAAALYLATPASAWVTGKIIEVDGGAESSVWPG